MPDLREMQGVSENVYDLFRQHVFQKKSKSGIATPRKEMALIRARLRAAQAIAKELEDEET